MEKITMLFIVCMLVFSGILAETQSNGSVTMSSMGDDILVILLHAEKKMFAYKVNSQGTCALKSVRTWHYDCQFANGLKTQCHSGAYPRDSLVDNRANGLKLLPWMKRRGYEFNPNYTIKGLTKGGGGSGGDLSVSFDVSRTSGLYVILDAETYALLVYEVNGQGIQFRSCRSILAEVQIPFYYPDKTAKNPIFIQRELRKMQKAINKKNPDIPFKINELKEFQTVPIDKKEKKGEEKTNAERGSRNAEEKKEEKKEEAEKK